jgi:HAD superfamily hydrolase (TIGR01549 family)
MKANRCILFDLDGTLYDSPDYSRRLEEEISKFVAEEMSTSYEAARVLLEERRKKFGTLTKSLESLGIDRARFFETMATRIEPSEYLSEDPTVVTTIEKLRRYGFSIGLVSNSGRPVVDRIMRALKLDQSIFDAIVTSSDVRPKPFPDPFLRALDLLNCRRQSAIYVGDRDEAELHPAKELGIRTILLDRTGKSSRRWADNVVGKLSEIPDVAKEMLQTL